MCERTVAGRSAFGTVPVNRQPMIHSRCASGVSACRGLISVVSRCGDSLRLPKRSSWLVATRLSLLYACRRSQQELIFRRSSQRAARSVNCTRAEGWLSLMHATPYYRTVESAPDLFHDVQHGIHLLYLTQNEPSTRTSRSPSHPFTTLSFKNCLYSSTCCDGILPTNTTR